MLSAVSALRSWARLRSSLLSTDERAFAIMKSRTGSSRIVLENAGVKQSARRKAIVPVIPLEVRSDLHKPEPKVIKSQPKASRHCLYKCFRINMINMGIMGKSYGTRLGLDSGLVGPAAAQNRNRGTSNLTTRCNQLVYLRFLQVCAGIRAINTGAVSSILLF